MRDKLSQDISMHQKQEFTHQADELLDQARDLGKRIRESALNGTFQKFKQNKYFILEKSHLGSLKTF